MTDAEISRRLALAIGWPSADVRENDGIYTEVRQRDFHLPMMSLWRHFDYRDPAVIWPIAERFNSFPVAGTPGVWVAYFDRTNTYAEAATAAKAVALAVIKAKGQK